MAFSPIENDLLVAGIESGSVTGLRVAPSPSTDAVLEHTNRVVALRISPNGRYLAVGMDRGELHLWDVHRSQRVFEISAWDGWQSISSDFLPRDLVAFSPDNRSVATIGPRRAVTIRNIEDGTQVVCPRSPSAIRANKTPTYSAPEFSPDGARLYVGGSLGGSAPREHDSGFIDVWDVSDSTPRPLAHLSKRLAHQARSIDISSDGRMMAVSVAGMGKPVVVFQLPEMKEVAKLKSEAFHTLEVRFSPNNKLLALSGFSPQAVILWDTTSWTRIDQLDHAYPVTHVSWSEDSKRIAASDFSAKTWLWDVETRQVIATFDGGSSDFSCDGTTLAVGAMGSEYVFDNTGLGTVVLHRAPPLSN